MPEYLSPGVYVEEKNVGQVTIEGVSTSTAGFVGITAKGPTDGLPVLVTSFGEFVRNFGGYLPESFGTMRFLPYAVQGFFDNGGQRVYIKRIVPGSGGPTPATSQNLQGGLITRLSKDVTAGSTQVQLSTMRGIQADTAQPGPPVTGHSGTTLKFTQVKDGIPTTETGIEVASYDDSTKTVTLKSGLQNSYQARYTTVATDVTDPVPHPSLSGQLNVDDTQAQLSKMDHIQAGTQLTFTQVKNGIPIHSEQVTVTDIPAGTTTVKWAVSEKLKNSYDVASTTVRRTSDVTIKAIDPGVWGNSIDPGSKGVAGGSALVIQVFHASAARSQVKSIVTGKLDTVELFSTANFYRGAIVEFNLGKTRLFRKVKDVIGKTIVLTVPFVDTQALDKDSADANFKTIASTCEFRLSATNNGITEDYSILTLDPQTPYYFETLINNQSKLITVSGKDDSSTNPFSMPSTDDGFNVRMGGGADTTDGSSGTITLKANDYIGQDNGPGKRTGIWALEDIEQISIIAAPGITDQSVVNALIGQCERLKYRFAILDPKYGTTTPLDDIQSYRQLFDTHYAALYLPNLKISNPDPASPAGSTIVIPPSGHMAGIYARTDIERGVHKAPANEVIRGILDLDLTINKGEQDILNPPPNNIDVLRDFRHQGRGLRVWGARCITSDAQWKYVNVRRLFIFVEASLDRGTQWVVFEPNDYPLWARVKQSISNFLTTVWRDGALMGQKVEEAFFVKVDRSTMTQDDIDNGRLIILVGIAPVKPAEFVIIRISQFTASANTTGQ